MVEAIDGLTHLWGSYSYIPEKVISTLYEVNNRVAR